MVRHTTFLAAAVFYALPMVQARAEPSLVLDSLSGSAEVMQAGQHRWRPVLVGAVLHNNDAIRALERSSARLRSSDGSTMYLHPGTQMLVNFYENKQVNVVSKHVTVFLGAVFFVVQKTLPRALASHEDFKVYTPTAVLAIRGTSFSVEVDTANGKTTTAVVNGTVLVRNIISSNSIFVGPACKTTVGVGADPVAPSPMLRDDVFALRTWVPAALIDTQIIYQRREALETRARITGLLEKAVVIIPFSNRSEYRGAWLIGRQLASVVAGELTSANPRLTAMVADSAGADPLEVGNARKVRWVLIGQVEAFDIYQFAQMSAQATDYRETCTARVRLRLQLVDVASRTMLHETVVTGEVGGNNVPANTWATIGKLPLSLDNKAFASSILGQATKQAGAQSAETFGPYLAN